MFDSWLKIPAHYYLRITALVLLVVGVALSNVLMSIGAIWIAANWLIEADFRNCSMRAKKSPEVWLIIGLVVYLIISLLWSDDLAYGAKDLRVKLPLLAIPLALGLGKPLESKIVYFLFYIFIAVVCLTASWNFISYNYLSDGTGDIREMSKFISQIRFATLVNLAIFITVMLWFEERLKFFIAIPIIIGLVFYTLKAQVLNGYLLLVVLSLYTVLYIIRKLELKKVKWLFGLLLVSLIAAIIVIVSGALKTYRGLDPTPFENLELYSQNGEPYFHDTTIKQTENGHYIWLYVAQQELESAWNRRSTIDYDSVDQKGQPMFGTVMRYMTSKNLRKDSVGVYSLSEEEIRQIEKGKTSVNMNNGLVAKIHSFLFEYEMYQGGGDPNGFSLLQRIEHLNIAKAILHDYWLTGVGVGDVDIIFQEYYRRNNSLLLPANRLRAHNQFVSLWIATGIIGFVCILLVFLIPLIKQKGRDYFLVITLISLIISFMFEDMLETQAGVTIFALFYSLAVFRETTPENQS